MKKILLATSALVALSGAAAAEITLSGDAQIGLRYDNKLVVSGSDWYTATDTTAGWNVISRARLTITMTGETDSGLSFGAKFRPGHANYKESRDDFSSATTVWAEGAYGKLTVGDVDSAVENAVGDLAEVGLGGLDFQNEIWYLPTDAFADHGNKGVLYSYNYGDVSFFASFEDKYKGYSGDKYDGNSWSLGVKYAPGPYAVGLGYAVGEEFGGGIGKVKTLGLSAETDMNGFVGKVIYVETKGDNAKIRQYGISGEYDLDNGVSLSGFYRHNKGSVVSTTVAKQEFLGLGAAYDLGGGATLKGGILHEKTKFTIGTPSVTKKRTIADVGLAFKF